MLQTNPFFRPYLSPRTSKTSKVWLLSGIADISCQEHALLLFFAIPDLSNPNLESNEDFAYAMVMDKIYLKLKVFTINVKFLLNSVEESFSENGGIRGFRLGASWDCFISSRSKAGRQVYRKIASIRGHVLSRISERISPQGVFAPKSKTRILIDPLQLRLPKCIPPTV